MDEELLDMGNDGPRVKIVVVKETATVIALILLFLHSLNVSSNAMVGFQ